MTSYHNPLKYAFIITIRFNKKANRSNRSEQATSLQPIQQMEEYYCTIDHQIPGKYTNVIDT